MLIQVILFSIKKSLFNSNRQKAFWHILYDTLKIVRSDD